MRKNDLIPLLNELATFVAVIEAGSFSEAARRLDVAPSAVSRSVNRLESALRTALIQRTTRKLRLTDTGENVFRHAQDMLRAVEAVAEVASDKQQEPTGKLRISAPRALGRHLIHPHIAEFLQLHPRVDVVFTMEDRPVDLIEDHIDLAFCITDTPSPGLMGRKLMRIEQIICAAPAYLDGQAELTHPSDLKQHTCIALSENAIDTRWRFSTTNKHISIDIAGRYFVNHAGARLDAITSGLGVGCVPRFMAEEALARGEVVQVLSNWQFETNYQGDLWMLYAPTRHIPLRTKSFIQYMVRKLGEVASHIGA